MDSERLLTLFAFGSAGDTRPVVALGAALRARGARVRVVAAHRFGPMITGAGLEHHGLDLDPMEIVSGEQGREWLASRNPVALLRGFRDVVRPLVDTLLAQATEGARGSAAVIAPATGFVGTSLAEHLAVPTALLHLQPGEPTRTAANPLVAAGRSLGAPLNRATYTAIEQLSWLLLRGFVNRWRTRDLGLPPVPAGGPFRAARRARVPVLCGWSPAVLPTPPDWPEQVQVTGYWFLDDDAPPSPRLEEFVAAGPAPVYIGFGSMVPKDPRVTWRAVHAAVRRLGTRAVLLGDPAAMAEHLGPGVAVDGSDGLLVAPELPHTWLFPRTAAVVHHGGAGTTGAALRAGAPSVVCPFFSDQPFWAARVRALGAGPQPLPVARLDADGLEHRLRAVLEHPAPRAAAQRVAAAIAADDGAARAAAAVARFVPGLAPAS